MAIDVICRNIPWVKFCCVSCLLMYQHTKAHDTLSKKRLTFSGYAETYFAFDFARPANQERPSMFYNFKRHNEVNLNLGYLKASYRDTMVRGSIGLMAGTYAQYNLASEQGLLRNVFEANAGVRISKHRELWIDAGIMPSHIGFESAVGKDCWSLTRSIMAENSPYYEAGVKLGYTSQNAKWYLAAMCLNGWQRIQRVKGNQTPAFGSQVTYEPTNKLRVNWSTFVGSDQPDSSRQWRYFNNFYLQTQLSSKFSLQVGFDMGVQQKSKGSKSLDYWHTAVLNLRYLIHKNAIIGLRTEYYMDVAEVIITTGTSKGFSTFGYSANFDYSFSPHVVGRMEARGLNSNDAVFKEGAKWVTHNYLLTGALIIEFNK